MARKIVLTDDKYEIELDLDQYEVYMTITEQNDPENSFATAGLNKHMIDELIETLSQLKEKLQDER